MTPASVTVVASGTTDLEALTPLEGLRLLGYSVQEDAGSPAVSESKIRLTASERQTITLTGEPTGGVFTLTFGAQETDELPWDATAAEVQAALEALSTIGAGNIVCAGTDLPAGSVACTFAGDLANADVGAITGADELTGGTDPGVSIAQNGFTGSELAFISLAASGSQTVWFGERGLAVGDGVFYERVSGTTVLTLYWTVND